MLGWTPQDLYRLTRQEWSLLLQEIESHPGDDRAAKLAEALNLNLVYAPAESAGNAGYEDAKAHLPQPKP